MHLALYCYHAGLATASLKLMYRARYLALLAYGKDHPDVATFDVSYIRGDVKFSIQFICFSVVAISESTSTPLSSFLNLPPVVLFIFTVSTKIFHL